MTGFEMRRLPAGRNLVRIGVRTVAGLALLWLVTVVSVANIYRSGKPELALRFASFDAPARARLAGNLSEGMATGSIHPKAVSLARSALARDATTVQAVRTLGLAGALEGRSAQSQRLFQYAGWLSRRDPPTQLWLIEYYVNRGDIGRALRHYDAALRTSPSSAAILFPVLLGASRDPAIARPLRQILARKPQWWASFVWQSINDGGDPRTSEYLVRGLLDLDQANEREMALKLLDRLVDAGAINEAFRMFRRLMGAGDRDELWLRNGDFEQENILPPFHWALSEDVDFNASLRPRPEGQGQALHLFQAAGRGGVVARQLLSLPSGSWRIGADIGGSTGDDRSRPYLEIRCNKGASLIQIPFPRAERSGRLEATVRIPSSCPGQWLSIGLPARMDAAQDDPWIDSVNISPL